MLLFLELHTLVAHVDKWEASRTCHHLVTVAKPLLTPTAQGQVFSERSIKMENYGSAHLYDEMCDIQGSREASQV